MPHRSAPNANDSIWLNAIDDLIANNGVVHAVVVPDSTDESTPRPDEEPAKLRPFAIKAERKRDVLTLERLTPTPERPRPDGVGSKLDVYLSTDTLRLVAPYEVQEVIRYALNERQRVGATRCVRIGAIESAQRRAFFRVDVANAGFGPVTLNDPGPAGLHFKPITGELANLSAGGVGVKVPTASPRIDQLTGRTFDFVVRLPDARQPIAVPVKVCRVEREGRHRSYLGLEFDLDADDPTHVRIGEHLARLTIDLQRAQLRRRRRA